MLNTHEGVLVNYNLWVNTLQSLHHTRVYKYFVEYRCSVYTVNGGLCKNLFSGRVFNFS